MQRKAKQSKKKQGKEKKRKTWTRPSSSRSQGLKFLKKKKHTLGGDFYFKKFSDLHKNMRLSKTETTTHFIFFYNDILKFLLKSNEVCLQYFLFLIYHIEL